MQIHQSPPLVLPSPLLHETSISWYLRLPYRPISDVSSSTMAIGSFASPSAPGIAGAGGGGGFTANMPFTFTCEYRGYVWVVGVVAVGTLVAGWGVTWRRRPDQSRVGGGLVEMIVRHYLVEPGHQGW